MSSRGDEAAFARPVSESGGSYVIVEPAQGGLTVREHFAGQALQGLLTNASLDLSATEAASAAVRLADALLEELER